MAGEHGDVISRRNVHIPPAESRVGSLEVGKEATLLITTGTPLDTTTDIDQAYIQGREIDMNDIQKHSFKKYMEKIKQQQEKVIS